MVQKIIGRRIQEIRKQRGLTQEQMAERVNISPHYLSALERGVYNIKLDLLVDILNILNCSADEVFQDVVGSSSKIKASQLSEKLKGLPVHEQRKILEVIEIMIANSAQKRRTGEGVFTRLPLLFVFSQ